MPSIPDNINELLGLPRGLYPGELPQPAYTARPDIYVPRNSWRDHVASYLYTWVSGPFMPEPRPIARLCNRAFDSNIRRDSPADILLHTIYTAMVVGMVVNTVGAALQVSELTLAVACWTIAFIYHVVAQDGVLAHLQY